MTITNMLQHFKNDITIFVAVLEFGSISFISCYRTVQKLMIFCKPQEHLCWHFFGVAAKLGCYVLVGLVVCLKSTAAVLFS